MDSIPAVVVGGIIMNITSVVGVVIMNKIIVTYDGFPYMVTLSFFHFVFTFLATRIMRMMGYLKYKDLDYSGVLPVAITSLLSVMFSNLNLSFNSVGFYQITKLMCIPVTLFIQSTFFQTSTSTAVKLTLVPLLLGIGIATVYDVSINLTGTVFGTCSILSTVFAQIYTSRNQGKLDCDAFQLLYHTSPIISLGMFVMAFFFDDVSSLYALMAGDESVLDNNLESLPSERQGDAGELMPSPSYNTLAFHILLSCLLAIAVNISNYIVLGKTSPLTYQVAGHLKTVFVLILGFLLFSKNMDYRNIVGICIAFVGVVAYTEVKRRESAGNATKKKLSGSQLAGNNDHNEENSVNAISIDNQFHKRHHEDGGEEEA
jgi:solute carrier family 35 protein E3